MLEAPDRLCVVVARTRHKMMQHELKEAANQGAKFVEVRLDFLAKAVDFKRLVPFKACQWLATIRRPSEGGRWPGQEDARQMVLRQAVVAGCFEWIDIETDIADAVRRFGSIKRVISYHNMVETPEDLDEIYEKMLAQDGDVYKLAVLPRTPGDLAKILAIQKRAPKPTICFGMGDYGFFTRFTALKFGSPWLYAMFNKERAIAPGLPALEDLRTVYPYQRINAETRFFGLLGDPVAQSHSPLLHNHLFARNQVNAFYVPLRVPDGQLPVTTQVLGQVPLSGYSVTIPHKAAAAELAKERESLVATTGVANTLALSRDGAWYALNTDYPAALAAIQHDANNGLPYELGQRTGLILGAGGAARALAFALHRGGMQVTVTSRSHEKAKALADAVGCKHCDWNARHNVKPCNLLVNCTPVGMYPNMDESPIHASFLEPGLVVFDTIYNPEQTLLIRDAKTRSCATVSGLEMFIRQAALQFHCFTSIDPVLEDLRELVRKALSPLANALHDEAVKSGFLAV